MNDAEAQRIQSELVRIRAQSTRQADALEKIAETLDKLVQVQQNKR